MNDQEMLALAVSEARAGLAEGGIPIGAALVHQDGPDRDTSFGQALSGLRDSAGQHLFVGHGRLRSGWGGRR